jgi:hypothetical protein
MLVLKLLFNLHERSVSRTSPQAMENHFLVDNSFAHVMSKLHIIAWLVADLTGLISCSAIGCLVQLRAVDVMHSSGVLRV